MRCHLLVESLKIKQVNLVTKQTGGHKKQTWLPTGTYLSRGGGDKLGVWG